MKVEKGDGCWLWTASRDQRGYGQFRVGSLTDPANPRRVEKAQRVAYELAIGPIPEGFDVCHHCDNPPCCRPDHLFAGTPRDNTQDMMQKGRHRNQNRGKTHCIHGHSLAEHGYLHPRSGKRYCRVCQRASGKAYRGRQLEQRRAANPDMR